MLNKQSSNFIVMQMATFCQYTGGCFFFYSKEPLYVTIYILVPRLFSRCFFLFRSPSVNLQKAVYVPLHRIVFLDLLFELAIVSV